MNSWICLFIILLGVYLVFVDRASVKAMKDLQKACEDFDNKNKAHGNKKDKRNIPRV